MQKNPEYQLFFQKIAQFVKNFQTEKIEDLIQQELGNEKSSA
ncbi:hypothetical protein [Dulcicalothrix desertica]|nr:hypothetical protein [Dulcicalothrix desertica]